MNKNVFEKIDICGPIEKGGRYEDFGVREQCESYLLENSGYCFLEGNNRNIQSVFLMKELLRYDLFMISPEFWESLYQFNDWPPVLVADSVRILDQLFDELSKN